MKKIILIALLASFGGCSNFVVNGVICDQIAQDPNTQNIPKECKKYDQKEATKAYFKKEHQQKEDIKNIIEFQKDKKD